MPERASELGTVPGVILDQARRQYDQQDAILDAHKRQAVLIAGAYLSTGTITIAALAPAAAAGDPAVDPALTIRAAVIVLGWSLGLGLIAGWVQWIARRWQGVVGIRFLIEHYGSSLHGRDRILELDLAATLEEHYECNKVLLYRIKRWLLIQVGAAVVGVGVLIQALRGLA